MGKKNKKKDQQQHKPVEEGQTYVKRYGCLGEGCTCVFAKWGAARRHMKDCSLHDGSKPELEHSRVKAVYVFRERPQLEVEFVAAHQQRRNVPEEELIEVVRSFYDKVGWDNTEAKKYVGAGAIRPLFGDFPFADFGYGTFQEWSAKHGLAIVDVNRTGDDNKKATS